MLDVRISALHGRGCFASAPVDSGSVVGRMEGVFTREDGDHVIWTSEDTALLVTNELRYLNWSRNPNAEVDPDTLEVRALRPIAPGEEVTIDYGAEWDRSEKELAADRIHSGFVVALARGLRQRLVNALQVVR